jgi:hypothetical protein
MFESRNKQLAPTFALRAGPRLSLPSFSVLTLAEQMHESLRLNIASVADQPRVHVEHIVKPAGRSETNHGWLAQDKRVIFYQGPDDGLYDALNLTAEAARGEILGCITERQQYLPGALRDVGTLFAMYPHVKVVVAGMLIVGPDGATISRRSPVSSSGARSWIQCIRELPCATFMRRSAFTALSPLFDSVHHLVREPAWILNSLLDPHSVGLLRGYAAVHVEDGTRVSNEFAIERDQQLLARHADQLRKPMKAALRTHRRLLKLLHHLHRRRPIEYAIYTPESQARRVLFKVERMMIC